MERQPILSEHYYPADERARSARVAELFASVDAAPEPAIGVVLPQGSLDATGAIAAEALARVVVPDVVVLLSFAHAGQSTRGAIATTGGFRLPGGRVPVDTRFAEDFANLGLLHEEPTVHLREHAFEAVLPLLLHRNSRMRIVPVLFGGMPHPTCVRIGNALADCINNHGRDVLVVATTSLAAYLPSPRVTALDARTIARVEELDGAGLHELASAHPEALDGAVPVSILTACARALGRRTATLCRHVIQTPNLDRSAECVGQASFVIR